MSASTGGEAAGRSRRTWRTAAVDALRSERAAWAVQNAIGALFAALFTVVLDLQFILACLCGVLYSASSLVLSLDRTVGGRLFGGLVFIGTVLGGACLGGGMVALAWCARGDGRALVDYLPEAYSRTLPSIETLQRLQDAITRLASLPLPPELRKLVDDAVDWASRELGELLPAVSPAYWGLLMALSAAVLLPFAVARAQREFGKGVIIAIGTVFLSSMLVFASLTPTLGMHLFWTEVVVGYIKVALVAAAATVLAGTLVCVRSAHDDVRRGCAALLRAQGAHVSRLGSALGAAAQAPAAPAPSNGTGSGAPSKEDAPQGARLAAAVDRQLGSIQAYVDARVQHCCDVAGVAAAGADKGGGPGGMVPELPALPTGTSDAELEVVWASLEGSMKTARLEPPLPLLCSQPGSSVAKYSTLKDQLSRLQQAAAVLERGQARCLHVFSSPSNEPAAAAAVAEVQAALSGAAALVAAACAGAAEALGHMPALAPCSGPALSWRPLPAAAWVEASASVADAARSLAASYQEAFQRDGLDFALSLAVEEHRSILFVLSGAAQLLDCAQAVEAAAAAALDVPSPSPPLPDAAAADGAADDGAVKPASTADAEDVEAGKLSVALQPASSPAAAPAAAKRPSALKRLAANPYVSTFVVLLALASPLLMLAVLLKSCWTAARCLPALLRSREARRAAARNRLVQYAAKYWLAMTGTVIVILAIMWKAVPDGPGPVQDAYQQGDFFVVWQPIYASITVAICLQDTVESSLFRGILRSTMTVLGGTLGYLLMLNGTLANNPYWVCAFVAAGSGLAGLLAPDRTLRYSLFLAVFTYNAVILCQYIGCCNVAGDPKVYAGKVVSTVIGSTVALLFSWVLPWYGSARMLTDQAAALRAARALHRRMLDEVAAAAAEGRPVCTDGWLETVESDIQAVLGRVAADIELNVIDRRQLPLTWHLLPSPAVLYLVQHAEGALRDRLSSAALALRRDLFSAAAGKPQTGSGSPAGAAVVPGPMFRRVLQQLQPEIEGLDGSLDALVEACADNMAASAAGSGLRPQRDAVAEAVAGAEAARLRLHRRYLEEQGAALEAAGGHSDGDFACQAWLHAMLRSVDEMMVLGRLLLLDPAQDRDVFWGWLRAWRGQRVVPA